jgi:hypothetical protein
VRSIGRLQSCWDGRPHFPRLPLDHKISARFAKMEVEPDNHSDRSRSGEERFSGSWNRRERSWGSQAKVTAIGGIAVIFQTSAGALEWKHSPQRSCLNRLPSRATPYLRAGRRRHHQRHDPRAREWAAKSVNAISPLPCATPGGRSATPRSCRCPRRPNTSNADAIGSWRS